MDFSALTSSFLSPLPPPNAPHHAHSNRRRLSLPILFLSSNPTSPDKPNAEEPKRNPLRLLQLSVTLTVVASALPQSPAEAKVSEKKQRAAKRADAALSLDELRSWSRGLPLVSDRIPYTDVLVLKEEGRLKHIVKPPAAALRQRPDPVLVVLDDSRVLRTVLPSVERDEKFWSSWDRLNLNSLCINAYTPPVKRPEFPAPYLGWFSKIPALFWSFAKPKQRSKRALELEKARRELVERRRAELTRVRKEREAMERALKDQKKADERKKRLEERKIKYEQSLRQARKDYQHMALVWTNMARDKNIVTALGGLFFFIFYRTVVYSYRRQRKDYEDRMKIEQAEAEERKKMRALEREMAGLEGSGEDEEEGKGGDQNPYLQMAKKFMQSGARVRRASGKRLPQYLERGVDVKFEDVAGLGNIRLELEEIVKFFTLGEMYRRRGVKIPGQDSNTVQIEMLCA